MTMALPPIIIGRWADEPEEDEYDPVAFQTGEATCQSGVSAVHVEQPKALASFLLVEDSPGTTKQQQEWTEVGTYSPCCVLSGLPSANSSLPSTAPSSPRSTTEPCSANAAGMGTLLQAPAAQPKTARERLEETMHRYGFGRAPSESDIHAQVSTEMFASRDSRIHDKPAQTIKEAAQLLQRAHDAQKGTLPRRRPELYASAHDSSARCSIPRQPAERDVHCSTIERRPVCPNTARPHLPSLRMLRRSVRASAAQRGCPPSRRGQPARQQSQPEQEPLPVKAAQPQDMAPIPCAATPVELHEQVATAPLDEPQPEDAEASLAVAAMPAEQQEETSGPSSTQAACCMPPALQFGTLPRDSSRYWAKEEQAHLPEQRINMEGQPATQHTAADRLICFGSFTEREAADLLLSKTAGQPAQLHLMLTAESIGAEAVAVSSTAVANQPGEPVNKSTPEAMLESTPTEQLTWPLALPIQACSLAQTCSRWLLPQKLQLPVNMAVNATIHVLAATSAAVDFFHGRQQ